MDTLVGGKKSLAGGVAGWWSTQGPWLAGAEALTAFEPKEATLDSTRRSSLLFFVSSLCSCTCVLVMPQRSQINTWNAMRRAGEWGKRADEDLRSREDWAAEWASVSSGGGLLRANRAYDLTSVPGSQSQSQYQCLSCGMSFTGWHRPKTFPGLALLVRFLLGRPL